MAAINKTTTTRLETDKEIAGCKALAIIATGSEKHQVCIGPDIDLELTAEQMADLGQFFNQAAREAGFKAVR